MTGPGTFDVLVIGSGASGLAAAVSAERAGARVGLATKGSLQACNSAKAQGGIQAAFGDDDSPEQHAADVFKSSHETADMRLVEVLTGDAQSAIHWLEELGVEFTRENGGYRLARCGGATREAPAPGRRPHRPRDHEGAARRVRGRRRDALRELPAARARAGRERLARDVRRARDRRGDRRPRRRRPLLPRGQERGELSTNHPDATGEVTQIALELGAEARDLDALQYHPNGGAWPRDDAGLLDSRRRRAPTAPCS